MWRGKGPNSIWDIVGKAIIFMIAETNFLPSCLIVMDILKEIESQINQIKRDDHTAYLDQIHNHLYRAETYYQHGQSDPHFYNDVIYRSNQAYEGALKEAFKVLASKTEGQLHKTNLHDIENHFAKTKIFKTRVLQLFENYRKEWRNKATHDHNLIFDEKEAFIALVSVSSFVHLLLKQIQEGIAFKNEQNKIQQDEPALNNLKRIVESTTDTFVERLLNLLKDFSNRNKNIIGSPVFTSIELLGMLHGFLSQVSDDLIIDREPKIEFEGILFRPDFIFDYAGEKVVLEVKRTAQKTTIQNARMKSYIDQMVGYLLAANIKSGIIYITKTINKVISFHYEKYDFIAEGNQLNIYVVTI